MGFFAIFSKTALTISFFFLQKEDITVLDQCAKSQVQEKSGSPDKGQKGGQKWGIRDFLKNQGSNLVPSPRKGRYHHSTYVCQVTGPDQFSFPRQGVKWGSKWVKNGFFVIFSKTVEPIWFHLLEKEDIIILHMCAKLQVQTIFRSRDRGSNGGEMGQKGVFRTFN